MSKTAYIIIQIILLIIAGGCIYLCTILSSIPLKIIVIGGLLAICVLDYLLRQKVK